MHLCKPCYYVIKQSPDLCLRVGNHVKPSLPKIPKNEVYILKAKIEKKFIWTSSLNTCYKNNFPHILQVSQLLEFRVINHKQVMVKS